MKTARLWVLLALLLPAHSTHAFSLLGPFEPWMSETNGFSPSDYYDIGGPMDITNGFRWNVPVVTYGFDQSFIDFFGTNGVAAVESAIQILNDLPPSSQINLTNYLLNTQRPNYTAMSVVAFDLKSRTLALLLEQMGLAQPTRSVFVMRLWDPRFLSIWSSDLGWTEEIFGSNLLVRNYDPVTLQSWSSINGTQYGGVAQPTSPGSGYIAPYPVDPTADTYTAVADQYLRWGIYYAGLTRDDVGGLAYLLSTNNVKFENLLPDVQPLVTNSSFVNGAWRPGVDKVTFVHQPVGMLNNNFGPLTNQFIDRYLSNGTVLKQSVARITTQPDILFRADFLTPDYGLAEASRTGTSNWINNAAANGNPNGFGPGVICPSIQIVFNKLGHIHNSEADDEGVTQLAYWGSFDGSTNLPVAYPISQTSPVQSVIQLSIWLGDDSIQPHFIWHINGAAGDRFTFQSSTNLATWTNLFTVTNNNCLWPYFVDSPSAKTKFYRLIPQ